jgi:hypothetical protein
MANTFTDFLTGLTKPFIKYKSGYKYQLVDEYAVKVSIFPDTDIKTEYIDLSAQGLLVIKKGYAWDGPSGPTIDTPNFMRGSLVHDALYQLLREKFIPQKWRIEADKELRRICREDGMSAVRARLVYLGVRYGGGPSASPSAQRPIHRAP